MLSFLIVCIYIFIIGNIIYSSKRKHLLIVLLSLEFIILRIFFLIIIYYINIYNELYFLINFLVFTVCEGALGLSILVSIIRTYGNDYIQSFNIL